MQNNDPEDQLTRTDDAAVLRYLLHTVKGLSPVSGDVISSSIEPEYIQQGDSEYPN